MSPTAQRFATWSKYGDKYALEKQWQYAVALIAGDYSIPMCSEWTGYWANIGVL